MQWGKPDYDKYKVMAFFSPAIGALADKQCSEKCKNALKWRPRQNAKYRNFCRSSFIWFVDEGLPSIKTQNLPRYRGSVLASNVYLSVINHVAPDSDQPKP